MQPCGIGHTLVALTHRSDGRVSGGIVVDPDGNAMQIEADLVVGADGADSIVARLAAAETLREARNTTAILYGYFPGLRSDGLSVVVPARHRHWRHSDQWWPALCVRRDLTASSA